MKRGLPKKAKQLCANSIGASYALGDEGLPRNYKKAIFWYQIGALQGDFIAQCNLGQMFYDGDVNKSYVKARKWFHESAKQGDGQAMYYLGEIYRNGYGVKKSFELAVYWYKKAVADGWPIHNAELWLSQYEISSNE